MSNDSKTSAQAASLHPVVIRRFPIIRTWHSEGAPHPEWIPWELLAPHEAQAINNHAQTLERLAERGGLDVCEAVAIIEDMRFMDRWGIGKNNGRDQTREAIEILERLCKPYNGGDEARRT